MNKYRKLFEDWLAKQGQLPPGVEPVDILYDYIGSLFDDDDLFGELSEHHFTQWLEGLYSDEPLKPGILVISTPLSEEFEWMSDGWNTVAKSGTPEAQELYKRAKHEIHVATDYHDAIRRLKLAGFNVSEHH